MLKFYKRILKKNWTLKITKRDWLYLLLEEKIFNCFLHKLKLTYVQVNC